MTTRAKCQPQQQTTPTQNNIVLHGFKKCKYYNSKGSLEAQIQEFIKTNLNLEIHRLDAKPLGNHNKSILVKLSSIPDKFRIFKRCKNLRKEDGVFITEDLSKAERIQRKQQLCELIRAKQQGKKAYFRGSKLVIQETPITPVNEWSAEGTAKINSLLKQILDQYAPVMTCKSEDTGNAEFQNSKANDATAINTRPKPSSSNVNTTSRKPKPITQAEEEFMTQFSQNHRDDGSNGKESLVGELIRMSEVYAKMSMESPMYSENVIDNWMQRSQRMAELLHYVNNTM